MERIAKLPPAFKRYTKMFGALNFAVFDRADGTEEEVLFAIAKALPDACNLDAKKLRSLGFRRIGERKFFGDWYDPENGMLLKIGNYKTADGSNLENPVLKTLDRVKITSGTSTCPDAGIGGQFAYAFSTPPYGLKGRPSEVQTIFEEIRDFILPPVHEAQIWDWSSPQLPEVSAYFSSGMEWWGVFLFSIHIPAIQRLTIVAGSTTD